MKKQWLKSSMTVISVGEKEDKTLKRTFSHLKQDATAEQLAGFQTALETLIIGQVSGLNITDSSVVA
ncbi:hypothetical protein [Lentilactobacillus senioris]|uniref:DUF1659 domain-containing protein n=1 Tax=Lentilactobacillus senioris DSM 24302 = JCM 17472 TaxID=1423802 RepID=A0A0R2CTT3_9LACO|nr:hypothetical protein [Lentilactobacillus senioris]KRM94514.1 hypothetical protein FC56_GL001471 [Lentilactobacillus senioris DSM 24302 = JCM 17472]MCY9806340.1 hypothetical protein [Lentilactobacillus senioris]